MPLQRRFVAGRRAKEYSTRITQEVKIRVKPSPFHERRAMRGELRGGHIAAGIRLVL